MDSSLYIAQMVDLAIALLLGGVIGFLAGVELGLKIGSASLRDGSESKNP